MAMKSVVLAAGLLLGSVQAITTEGMLAAPRRSTGILNAKGVCIFITSLGHLLMMSGQSIVLRGKVQLDDCKDNNHLVLPRH
jgi:hypothetical protein